jgi:hypothetical protein
MAPQQGEVEQAKYGTNLQLVASELWTKCYVRPARMCHTTVVTRICRGELCQRPSQTKLPASFFDATQMVGQNMYSVLRMNQCIELFAPLWSIDPNSIDLLLQQHS